MLEINNLEHNIESLLVGKRINIAHWKMQGSRLFGTKIMNWKFKCPMCGQVQSKYSFEEYLEKVDHKYFNGKYNIFNQCTNAKCNADFKSIPFDKCILIRKDSFDTIKVFPFAEPEDNCIYDYHIDKKFKKPTKETKNEKKLSIYLRGIDKLSKRGTELIKTIDPDNDINFNKHKDGNNDFGLYVFTSSRHNKNTFKDTKKAIKVDSSKIIILILDKNTFETKDFLRAIDIGRDVVSKDGMFFIDINDLKKFLHGELFDGKEKKSIAV